MTDTSVVVPAALRWSVAGVDVLRSGDHRHLTHLPDVSAVLVWRATAGQSPQFLVRGARTHASYNAGDPVTMGVRLRIKPGWGRVLLGLPMNELTDQITCLDALWGRQGECLTRELADLGDDPLTVLARIETVLVARLATRTASDLLSRAALTSAALHALRTPPRPSIPVLAGHLGVSERQLRDLFATEVGVSPKRCARISRIRHVLADAGCWHWAQLASDAGYYDQAHLIAEFRAMMGITPGAFRNEQLPAARPC